MEPRALALLYEVGGVRGPGAPSALGGRVLLSGPLLEAPDHTL